MLPHLFIGATRRADNYEVVEELKIEENWKKKETNFLFFFAATEISSKYFLQFNFNPFITIENH